MDSVITTIHQCRQRGERPLSVVELIEKDLITLQQAAWLVSRIEAGASWLVGAIPGHAGKTTLMSALLVFLPAQEQVTLAQASLSWGEYGPGCCVVAEEISDHGREQYLWGEAVRSFTSVPARGGRIAATIHATTVAQVREQVARGCAAGEDAVAAFDIFIPIEVTYAPDAPEDSDPPQRGRHRRPINSRTVEVIHYHDGSAWQTLEREPELTAQQESIAAFLHSCLASGIHECEALRQAWLVSFKGAPA